MNNIEHARRRVRELRAALAFAEAALRRAERATGVKLAKCGQGRAKKVRVVA